MYHAVRDKHTKYDGEDLIEPEEENERGNKERSFFSTIKQTENSYRSTLNLLWFAHGEILRNLSFFRSASFAIK